MSKIIVSIGATDVTFDANDEDFNQYLNEQSAADKIAPAWNFLSRTVEESSRANLNRVALTLDNKPKGVVVLQIAAIIAQELGGDLVISVKKPKALPTASPTTPTDN